MHIAEGVLATPVLVSGVVITLIGTAYALKKLPWNKLMPVASLAAAFFAVSLIHIPIGISSAHLTLSAFMGIILAFASFPVVLVALFLQTLLFQFGGFFILGINTSVIAISAIICGKLFRVLIKKNTSLNLAAFLCGALGVAVSAGLCSLALFFSGESFLATVYFMLLAHVPIMFLEAALTVVMLKFILKIAPDMLEFEGE